MLRMNARQSFTASGTVPVVPEDLNS